MNRRLLFLGISAVCAMFIRAQDMDIVAQRDIQGSARYVGMAGAMTAVGGDPSAVLDNPAGLGIYRHSEVAFSLSPSWNKHYQYEIPDNMQQTNRFNIAQASFVFSFGETFKERGLLFNNIMLSYHRLADLNRSYLAAGLQTELSLAEIIANNTNGLTDLQVSDENRWANIDVGWLSCQGYDTYLINPIDNKHWTSVTNYLPVTNSIQVQETGYVNAYGFTWGGNISNKLYIGATLNILSYYRNQTVRYFERIEKDCDLLNETYFSQSAVGINGVFGFLYHPLTWLRVGASFQTPGMITTTSTNYGTLSASLYLQDTLRTFYSSSPQNSITESKQLFPMRVSSGVAFQFQRYGLISLQYDYAHSALMQDVHTLKVGLEGVICHNYFINAGYAYESMFKTMKPEELSYNTVRTDANTQYILSSQYGSIGGGYRNRIVAAHLAYQLRYQQMDVFAHELVEVPYDIRALTHRLVFTLTLHW